MLNFCSSNQISTVYIGVRDEIDITGLVSLTYNLTAQDWFLCHDLVNLTYRGLT